MSQILKKVKSVLTPAASSPPPDVSGLTQPEASGLPLEDRMMRYRQLGSCPKCGARPIVCLMLRPDYAKFHCRACDHIWEKVPEEKG